MFETSKSKQPYSFLKLLFLLTFLGGCFYVEDTVFHGTTDEGDIGNEINFNFVLIPAGSFTMGSPDNELEQHQVTITRSFYMQTHEVTQGEWKTLMGNNPSYYSSLGDGVDCGANCPVEQVNWYEALAYANALSASKNLQECYTLSDCENSPGNDMECTDVSWDSNCLGYRLPTEAEWEYAIRARTATAYYNGDDDNSLGNIAWYGDNSNDTTHSIAQLEANSWGLYDMSGNVWEWCWDWYDSYGSSSAIDPIGPSAGSSRVLRGGSWYNSASGARSAYRNYYDPGYRYYRLGFRLVSSAH